MSGNQKDARAIMHLLLSAEDPLGLTVVYLLLTSLYTHGPASSNSFCYLGILLTIRMLSPSLHTIRSRTLQSAAFLLVYQLLQSLVITEYMAGDGGGVVSAVLISTGMLFTGELHYSESALMSAILLSKHCAIWIYMDQPTAPYQKSYIGPLLWVAYCTLVTQLRRMEVIGQTRAAENSVLAEKLRLKSVLNAIPDGVVVLSEGDEVLSCNHVLVQQLGISECSEPESRVLTAISKLRYDPEFSHSETTLLTDLHKSLQCRVGSVVEFSPVLFSSKVLECRGNVLQWDCKAAVVLTVRDTTHWAEVERVVKKESEDKSAMLRSVSHELRTPVNAIINLAQDLQSSPTLSSSDRADVDILLNAANFLMLMVNDLLDYSRIIYGNFALSKTNFELERLVHTCGSLIESQCRTKKIRFSIRYDQLLPRVISTDENRLKQVVLNLLTNAAKYTLKGSVTLIASLSACSRLKISVEDTGIGISAVRLRRLLCDDSRKEGTQGCGLGLRISQMLVKKLGGSGIDVVSTLGQGSVFSFTVPITTVVEARTMSCDLLGEESEDIPSEFPQGVSHLPPSSPQRQRFAEILIVDDSPFNRLVLSKILTAAGYSVAEACTGLEALRAVIAASDRERPFAVVVMDVEMPEMDGLTATRELRKLIARGVIRDAPVIIGCSAYCSEEDRAAGIDAGMKYYLVKPVSRSTLLQLVTAHRRLPSSIP